LVVLVVEVEAVDASLAVESFDAPESYAPIGLGPA
jgi:hypothetical protein